MPKLEQQSNNFSEFDIVIETWIDLREDLILPIRVDIADIDFSYTNFVYNKFEKQGNDIIVDLTPNPFEVALLKAKVKAEYVKIFKFIDNKNELYEHETIKNKYITLFEHLQINSYEELYDYFIDREIDDEDLCKLKNTIITYINQITEIFKERAFKYLEVNSNPHKGEGIKGIDLKKFDTNQTQTFIKLQSIIEYNANPPIFPENKGKSLQEFSWRELQLRMLFLHRKNQVDSELKRIENSAMKTPTEQPKKIVTGR